jgi:hypothetical protein
MSVVEFEVRCHVSIRTSRFLGNGDVLGAPRYCQASEHRDDTNLTNKSHLVSSHIYGKEIIETLDDIRDFHGTYSSYLVKVDSPLNN